MEVVNTQQGATVQAPGAEQVPHQAPNAEQHNGLDRESSATAPDPTTIGAVALREPVDADSWRQKPTRAEQVAALQKQIADAVEALVDAGAWRRMLDVAARFHDYSTGTTPIFEHRELPLRLVLARARRAHVA